jgi:hypothetical protein
MTSMAYEKKSPDIVGLLTASDLTYLADSQTNVVSERSQRKTFAQKAVYSARETVVLTLNTGNDFIARKESSLKFVASPTGSTTATFGGGSALNLFDTIRVISRSGDVLTEVTKSNVYNYYTQKIQHTKAWRTDQQGQALMGFGGAAVTGTNVEFIIPLSSIIPFFDDPVLLPAVVARGLRIEIVLANTAVAFQDAGSLTGYTLSGIELLLDSYRLSTGAMNALNTMAASDGLVLTYKDVNNSPSMKALNQLSFSTEVRQSVSMANYVFAAIRPVANALLLTADSFATGGVAATDSYQYRIGSVYLPQERIVGKSQWYNQVGYCWGKLKSGGEMGVTFTEFDDNALSTACLDRYWTAGSGMAINSSTVLNLSCTVAVTAESTVDIFLCHTRRAVCFLESVTVLE